MTAALLVGWATGLLASLAGFAASLAFDLPTGTTLVLALAASLVVAGAIRLLYCGERDVRQHHRRHARRVAVAGTLALVLVSSLWSLVRPDTDQPLFAALALLGLRPELFLRAAEATQYEEARRAEQHDGLLVDSLSDQERRARWQGAPLSDDDIWRIASYQQTYNEMGKGERFVQNQLLARARERERWLVSLPLGLLSTLCLVVIFARRLLLREGGFGAAALWPAAKRARP
jgi:zinc/manganese transport system permease protein